MAKKNIRATMIKTITIISGLVATIALVGGLYDVALPWTLATVLGASMWGDN